MPEAPSGRVLRYAGWSAYISAGLAVLLGVMRPTQGAAR
jgi:hypothetical protein